MFVKSEPPPFEEAVEQLHLVFGGMTYGRMMYGQHIADAGAKYNAEASFIATQPIVRAAVVESDDPDPEGVREAIREAHRKVGGFLDPENTFWFLRQAARELDLE